MSERQCCPRCGRRAWARGHVEVDGQSYPVYQCLECLDRWQVDGQTIELALTWAVDERGVFLPEGISPETDADPNYFLS